MPPLRLGQNTPCVARWGRIARGAADTRTPTVLLMRGRRHLSRPRTAAPWQAAGRGGRRAAIKRPALRRGAGWHRTGISPLTEPQTAVSCSASALDRAEGHSPAGRPTCTSGVMTDCEGGARKCAMGAVFALAVPAGWPNWMAYRSGGPQRPQLRWFQPFYGRFATYRVEGVLTYSRVKKGRAKRGDELAPRGGRVMLVGLLGHDCGAVSAA